MIPCICEMFHCKLVNKITDDVSCVKSSQNIDVNEHASINFKFIIELKLVNSIVIVPVNKNSAKFKRFYISPRNIFKQ